MGINLALNSQTDRLYLAPEVFASDGAALTTASDIYSLGVTIYTLACGTIPFQFQTDIQEANLLWKDSDRLSSSFKKLIAGMIREDPEQRLTLEQVRLGFSQ